MFSSTIKFGYRVLNQVKGKDKEKKGTDSIMQEMVFNARKLRNSENKYSMKIKFTIVTLYKNVELFQSNEDEFAKSHL